MTGDNVDVGGGTGGRHGAIATRIDRVRNRILGEKKVLKATCSAPKYRNQAKRSRREEDGGGGRKRRAAEKEKTEQGTSQLEVS